jgi:outer membrane protein W
MANKSTPASSDETPLFTSTNPGYVADAAVLAAITALQASLGSLVVDADGRTITAAESSTVFSNEGATAIDPFVLPAAAAGLNFTFIVQDADGIRVTAAAGDTIRIATAVSAAAGKIEATAIGSVARLYAINATEWIAVYAVGAWTVT